MKNELPVEFEIGFAASKILSYSINDGNVSLFLECWNSAVLEINFLYFASLFAMNYTRIADFREVFESSLLERALEELYEKKPKEHLFRVFRFLNSDDITAFEIVCEDIKVKKISS